MRKILCLITGGAGDEARARLLTAPLDAEITYYSVDRTVARRESSQHVTRLLQQQAWDLVYLEGTGIAGGLPLIRAAKSRKQLFIVSSGDPIGGFFAVTRGPVAGYVFTRYEKMLYRSCTGFVGWTPYLTGKALELGAKRAATAEGGVNLKVFHPYSAEERKAAKEKYGLNPDHLVCGVVGSLTWTPRQSYCYGLELVESLKYLKRQDISVLIVGDGDGRARLEERVSAELRSRIIFTGRLAQAEVVQAINALDIGFITQTLDALGNYRLTTKLPEYLACGVPVAMSPVPGFYDYALPAGWPLPPLHPASAKFHTHCAQWLDGLTAPEIAQKASSAPAVARHHFDYDVISARFCSFINDLLETPEKTSAPATNA